MATELTKQINDQDENRENRKGWLKRFGVAGLFFFTVKGLLWLLVPLFIARGCL